MRDDVHTCKHGNFITQRLYRGQASISACKLDSWGFLTLTFSSTWQNFLPVRQHPKSECSVPRRQVFIYLVSSLDHVSLPEEHSFSPVYLSPHFSRGAPSHQKTDITHLLVACAISWLLVPGCHRSFGPHFSLIPHSLRIILKVLHRHVL